MGKLEDKMNEVTNVLKNMQNYNTYDFANQLYYWVKELDFFYSHLVPKQGGDPSKTFYEIKPSNRPKEGQVAYFNIRKGYPKETYDGHYCYIVKDFGYKCLIIPTTSVKEDSSALDERFEIDVHLKDFPNNAVTRMQVTDIRVVDFQRINEGRTIYNVIEDTQLINEKIKKILFN